ncbi:MAG: response regulator transcription factor [Dehalococcoidia bacterium]
MSSSLCVLVVDDDPGIRDTIQFMLEDAGYAVVTATSGPEALTRVLERAPALVLLDLQMPLMSGQETLARLRDMPLQIPVIFMTAGLRAQIEAAAHGADGHLAKPFEFEELLHLVRRFCA